MFDPFMTRIILFNLLLFTTCGYAILRGGAPEKLTGWLLMAAASTTFMIGWRRGMFVHLEVGVFVIDLALLVALVVIALKADRFWPLVLAAMQLDSTAVHILKLFDQEIVSFTYALMIAMWAYPMQIILAMATLRHQRRLAQFGEDRAWTLAFDQLHGETADATRNDAVAQPRREPWGSQGRDQRAERDRD